MKRKILDRERLQDPYFKLMNISWWKFFLLVFLAFFGINLIFACIYYLGNFPISGGKGFLDYFYFSVQTVSTIGYGNLAPVGNQSNLLVSVQAIIGIIFAALITGVFFSKFSTPKSKIVFSSKLITTTMDGKKYLSFRVGNIRANDIVDTNVKVTALIERTTAEGEKIRRLLDLKLLKDHTPFFSLSWAIFHPLEDSPIEFDKLWAISTLVIGHDGTYSQTVYSRKIYYPDDIVYDTSFEDVIFEDENGETRVNFAKFHDLKS